MRPFAWETPMWHEMFEHMETVYPKVDLIERDEEILVRAELPGVQKDDLEVSVSNDLLTIKAVQRKEEKEERGDFLRREISHGAFSRTLRLPAMVDTAKAKARFEGGVLELVMAKVEKARRQTIRVE